MAKTVRITPRIVSFPEIIVNQRQQGFLLTHHSRDNHQSTDVVLWLSTPHGPARLVISDQQPLFFVLHSQQQAIEQILSPHVNNYHYKALALKTFDQQPVAGLYFDAMHSFYNAKELLQAAHIPLFESDFRLQERFLMERYICGGVEFIGVPHQRAGFIEYRQVKVRPCDYLPQLRVISLDIECSAKGELYSVGLYGGINGQAYFRQVIMIGAPAAPALQPTQPEPLQTTSDQAIAESATETIDYITWVKDETALLNQLVHTFTQQDPDVIIGWNVINFDFKLLIQRAALLKVKLPLGRNGASAHWRDSRSESNQGYVTLPGRVVVDGIDALKSATYNFESFSLEFVAQQLLQRGKQTEDVHDRLATIMHDFIHNKVKLASYNLADCILVWDIFNLTKVMDFLLFRSQLTGLALDRIGGSVAAFTNLYLPKLHRAGYVAPNLPPDGGLASPGGYVMSSRPGLYQHVLVLDFKSLYPSIIRTFNIDPMGLIEGLQDQENAIPGFKGAYFSREKHFLPEIIRQLWQQRDEAKRHADKPRSQAIKIIMNSFYGVLGSGGCRFYDTRLASSITMRGHEIMQQTARWIEAHGLQVIYGDTDSTFVWLNYPCTNERADEIGRQLVNDINQKWQQHLQEQFNLPCYLELEYETHFNRFLMPTIRGSEVGSKKRYAGLIVKNGQEKMVFKGLETVRTDWTILAKNFQNQLFDFVFHDQDPSDYVRQIVLQTRNGELDDQLVYRKRLRRKLDQYIKNVPPHVRAARIADEFNRQHNRQQQYQYKGWISYLITIHGPEPLECRQSAIDYEHYIDKQLRPVADAILPFIDLSFDQLVNRQMGLF